uniref:F-box associated domain-containing protein n=1 Tax=Aegilops tauschii subsp. strangulata TaxID=200361 RepID=A0A453CUE0_AEGTS
YKTSLMDLSPDLSPRLGIATRLKPHYIVHGDDHGPRHFFLSGSELYAVSFLKDGMYVLNLDTRCEHLDPLARRPVSSVDPFIMVIQVGRATLALTETLQVYRKAHLVCPPRSSSWVRCMTDHSQIPDRKVKLSGYVVVSDNSFTVCDTLTCSCLHFNLDAKKWHVVMPWAPWGEYPPRDMSSYRFLNGRCVFVDGFIYTCSGKGLAAYELLYEDNCVYLDIPIYLPLSWESEMWRTERMCLDYAGKDVNSGAILFWVVQGEYLPVSLPLSFMHFMKDAITSNVLCIYRFANEIS